MTDKEYALLNAADYSSPVCLRKLYKGLRNLQKLAENGNTTAQCIVIDLQDGLAQIRGDQKEYVQDVLINGWAMWETAAMYDRTSGAISQSISQALSAISKYLSEDGQKNER